MKIADEFLRLRPQNFAMSWDNPVSPIDAKNSIVFLDNLFWVPGDGVQNLQSYHVRIFAKRITTLARKKPSP